MLVEVANKTRSRINLALVKRVLEKLIIAHHLQKKSLSVAFIGDQRMRVLNRQFRGKDYPTDILSFAAEEADCLGELIIDWQQIKQQALKFNNTAKQEMIFILTHGFLHLLGHRDDTERRSAAMLKLGADLIDRLKLNDL